MWGAGQGGGELNTATNPLPLRAFHGDPAIKEFYLARVRAHRAADDIIRGTYGDADGASGWRGCAVGCTIHGGNHSAYVQELGIPTVIADIEERLFEEMPLSTAMDWPVEFLESIPVGADLSRVLWQLFAWGIHDFLRHVDKDVQPTMERILTDVFEPRARGEFVDDSIVGDAEIALRDAARNTPDRVTAEAVRATCHGSHLGVPSAMMAIAFGASAVERRSADAAATGGYMPRSTISPRIAIRGGMEAVAYLWSRRLLAVLSAAPVPAQEVTR